MRAICIARHGILSQHLCSVFGAAGLDCTPAVGFDAGVEMASATSPDAVICDYDLLASAPLGIWERDPVLGAIPVIAVSLTRRPEDVQLLDANGIAGFLYLPALSEEAVLRMVQAVTRRVQPPPDSLRWRRDEHERARG